MPLDKSCAVDAVSANISSEMKAGKPQKQAIAIALSVLKRSCGVPDDDAKMTPKEIVAAGSKGESYFRVASLFERSKRSVPVNWQERISETAAEASVDAERQRAGRGTREFLETVHTVIGRRPAATENLGSDWDDWRNWVVRVEMAAHNGNIQALGEAIREYLDGSVRPPAPISEIVKKGIDFAVRSVPRGASTSPSSAPPEANSGANVGTFRFFADNGKIKAGDGRAPRGRR